MFEHIPWQDLLFSSGGLIFTIALIPSILSDDKPALSTSLMTAVILSTFSYAYFTLELWLSVFGGALVAGGWWVLAVQKYLIDRR